MISSQEIKLTIETKFAGQANFFSLQKIEILILNKVVKSLKVLISIKFGNGLDIKLGFIFLNGKNSVQKSPKSL